MISVNAINQVVRLNSALTEAWCKRLPQGGYMYALESLLPQAERMFPQIQ